MKRCRWTRTRLAWTASAVLLALALPSNAWAQTYDDDPTAPSWRRGSQKHRFESPQNYAFEIRFGPYRPNIDDEFGWTDRIVAERHVEGPYDQVFGGGTRWHIGVELDWQALRIPHVGSLGPGVSLGYTRSKAKALRQDNETESAEDTSLWIMPTYALAVARVDVLANEVGIPLVPYVKFGLGYALWRTSDASGTSEFKNPDGSTVNGKGHSYGWTFMPGIAVQLDPFDRHAAQQLDNSVGVNHSYIFLEWMRSKLDGFGAGDQLRVGTSTWVAGLALEF